MASIMATELATLVSEASMRHFDYRMLQMRALCDAWKADRETLVKELNEMEFNESVVVNSCSQPPTVTMIPAFNDMESNE